MQQLDATLQSGSWMVYSEGDEGVKPSNNKGYFTNLDDFLAHVKKEYLVRLNSCCCRLCCPVD